jgi:hypothetical protein
MDGFKADAGAIGAFGDSMQALKTDASSAKTYAEDHLDIGHADTRIFATIAGAAADAKQALSENYARLAAIQEAAASELDKAALMYQNTDAAEAERLDRTYPGAGG